ncbi:MAG: hypothetical protein KF773_26445 [Deltaproteobacteria bacterium]|nr:hypothetical protein [Deltaproteobacteria bacterium]MCW5804909.1 hypothetical protein [Deltaproteobacteria bacterium]
MRKLMATIGAAGAACATPYQPMGFTGGYADRRMPNGDYLVTVKVNGFTDRATAMEYLHRRAGEICPQGYDLIDRSSGDNGGITVTRSYISETKKPEENAVVRCKDSDHEEVQRLAAEERAARRRAASEPRPRPDPPPRRGFYCSASVFGPTSLCTRDPSACEQARALVAQHVDDLQPCSAVEVAHCFDSGNGNREGRCAATAESCAAQRDAAVAATKDVDVVARITACERRM